MNGEEILGIIFKCAKQYQKNLLNRKLLFVYGSINNPQYFEVVFLKKNFLHLTGVGFSREIHSPGVFYEKLLQGQISYKDLLIRNLSLAERKLMVLPSLMSIGSNAKMVGEYSDKRPLLKTEVLAGGVRACMGFVKGNDGCHVPNTVLQEDLRNITKKPQQRVLAVFRKDMNCEKYEEVTYTANGVALENINFPEELKSKISLNPSIMFGKVVNSDSENKELNILPSEKIVNDNLPEKEENQSSNKAPASFERRHIADIMKDAKEKADRINREIANNSQKNKGFDR